MPCKLLITGGSHAESECDRVLEFLTNPAPDRQGDIRPMSVSEGQKGKELYEFGHFRVDAQRELLFRGSEQVALTTKTFRILMVLIRHGNEIVTKDELMKTVWPDTFVGEDNLSRHIFMLRKVLGESPQDHRYVVTVPGQGYRFAESVHAITEQEVDILAASHSKVHVQIEQTKQWGWISLAVILLLAVASGAYQFFRHRPARLTPKDTVVLADFANSTGDPVFEGTLRQGMAVQLAQSPFLSLISEQRIEKTLRLMGRPADAPLTPETAREICERTGSAAVLEGSIANLGTQFVVGLRAEDCGSGDVLDVEQAQAARKEDVLTALSQIAVKFRTRVGESLTTVEKYSTPLAEATTGSLDALKAYSAGLKVGFSTNLEAGVPYLQQAVAIDPDFAMAHGQLGIFYEDLGEPLLATTSTIRAYQLGGRTSERERLFITALYQRQATGNLEDARRTCEQWTRTYPRDIAPHGLLSGFIYQGLGQYEKSIDEARSAISLDQGFAPAYVNLTSSDIFLNRPADAERTMQQAAERELHIPELVLIRYQFALLRNDVPGMDREAALAAGNIGIEDWMSHAQALVLARSGQMRLARKMSDRAIVLAQQAGQQERVATYEAAAAVSEALFDNAAAARRRSMAALALSNSRDVEYAAAFALGLSSDSSRAQALANDLQNRFPEDTSVKYNYLPALRGLLALTRGDAANAIEQSLVPYPHERAVTHSTFSAFFGTFYPALVRGEAYLASHKGAEAAAEFRQILSQPGLLLGDPAGAVAQLQLARAYAMQGDTAKAREAYLGFLTLWKSADPDIPLLKRAKAEFAILR
jgi:eukaryotic-like serine/threonine-protein kinase